MDNYRRLKENLRSITDRRQAILLQGIVRSVEGVTCTVDFEGTVVGGIRLRASQAGNGGQLLVVPKAGTPVIAGSIDGTMNHLAVLSVDQAESITVNGGQLGGLVNIAALTEKLNALVDAFNGHTHAVQPTGSATAQSGTAAAPAAKAQAFSRSDYEDKNITH